MIIRDTRGTKEITQTLYVISDLIGERIDINI